MSTRHTELDTQVREQLQRCLPPCEQAHCLPPAAYASQALLDVEVERIFRRSWIGIGRADRLAAPGSYATQDIAGTPVIVLRDSGGRLRVFNNSCRHRGARLLDGEGSCRTIRCPFHRWSYALDGRLLAASQMEHTSDFDRAEHGLVEFAVAEHAGFVFVSLAARPPDFDTHLGDFDRLHQPWPLATLVTTRRQRFEVACNWKLFLDVFNEYYHLKFVHRASFGDIYAKPDPGDATRGAYASQFGTTEGTGGLLESEQQHALPRMAGLSGRPANGARYSWVFPNMTFAAGTDALWMYEAHPLGPSRCEVFQTLCFPPETVALADFQTRAARYYHRLDAAMAEDIVALENQQRGLASPYAVAGRFSVLMEPNVAAFARWYAGQMLGGADDATPRQGAAYGAGRGLQAAT